MTFTLESDRLLLRDWLRADWKEAQEYSSDPAVCKYMIWGPNTERETKDFIDTAIEISRIKPRRGYELALILKEEERLIGGCGMQIVGPNSTTAMIGYVLNRNYWNRGIMTEAANLLLEFGFGKLNLHRIYATCDTENSGSERIMQKLGMRREGQFVKDTFIKERWRDSYLYAILEEEWLMKRLQEK